MVEFRYELTFREFRYLLFGKKICPHCESVLTQYRDFEMVYSAKIKSDSVMPAKVKVYKYSYVCPLCGSKFSLTELSDKWKG